MAKPFSNVFGLLGRCLKAMVVVLLLPLPVGLLGGILKQLEVLSASGATFREWTVWGFMGYVGFHVLLYRPQPLFRVSHRVFSAVAVWLFGGQVSTVGSPAKEKSGKGSKGNPGAQGSPLVAFSPYAVPVYTIAVCAVGGLLQQAVNRPLIEGPVAFLIGVTMAFHWLMTADDLQQQRAKWHVETYLLAIALVFALTLLIAAACLPMAVPGFSFTGALSDGLAGGQAIYAMLIRELFL